MARVAAGLALLVAAGAIQLGLTAPARQARDEAREAYARTREERERLRAELARLERRRPAAEAATPGDPAAAARALRLSLLAATRGLPIGSVQIATRVPRGQGAVAQGQLSGTGRQADLLRVADRLAEPGSGAWLERVELSLGPDGVRLDAQAAAAGSGS